MWPVTWEIAEGHNCVARRDMFTGLLVGTYPLAAPAGETCHGPGQVLPTEDGGVWVTCRGINPFITSNDLQPDMVPQRVDHKVVRLDGDGDVLFSLEVGHAPSDLLLDEAHHLWVTSVMDGTRWELDGETGACLRGISTAARPCTAPPQ